PEPGRRRRPAEDPVRRPRPGHGYERRESHGHDNDRADGREVSSDAPDHRLTYCHPRADVLSMNGVTARRRANPLLRAPWAGFDVLLIALIAGGAARTLRSSLCCPSTRVQSRRSTMPSTITGAFLDPTRMDKVPERSDANVATGITFRLTLVADRRSMVLSRVDPQ